MTKKRKSSELARENTFELYHLSEPQQHGASEGVGIGGIAQNMDIWLKTASRNFAKHFRTKMV